LFNILRHRLQVDSLVTPVSDPSSLEDLRIGSVVEMTGTVNESPLQRIVDLMNNFLPFAEESVQMELRKTPTVKRNQRNQLNPEQRAALEAAEKAVEEVKAQLEQQKQLMKMVELIDQDLKRSPMVDVVVQGEGVAGFVSTSREYLTDDVTAAVLGGTFRVLGKVTAVDTRPDARIAVIRRGAMGAVFESAVEPMLGNMRSTAAASGLQIDIPEGQLKGPNVHLIPLAIFV
jgi:hypothetical protein